MKKIILTGGGTAGHVTPNIALLPALREAGYDISYIGSYNGIEKTLMEQNNITYYGISTGKLRRYFSKENFKDPFKVIKGFSEAKKLIKEIKPDIVFSKGGFVSVPVVLAARAHKVPVICHECDMTPGLANKLSAGSATKICCNFPETLSKLPANKAVLSGTPIRAELLSGSKERGLKFTGLSADKPIIMVMGGSSGAKAVNEAIRSILPTLLKDFQVIHLCGKGKTDNTLTGLAGYVQYEYISDELRDLFACTDLIVSRAGANAICEILALRIPNLLIPLSAKASRGDQILNANSFKASGYSMVLEEENITNEVLLSNIKELYNNRERYIDTMSKSELNDSISIIMDLINKYS